MTSIQHNPIAAELDQKACLPEEGAYVDLKALPEDGQTNTRVRDEIFYFEYTVFEVSTYSGSADHQFDDTIACGLGR